MCYTDRLQYRSEYEKGKKNLNMIRIEMFVSEKDLLQKQINSAHFTWKKKRTVLILFKENNCLFKKKKEQKL